jgi:serine/threonine-protein kinase
MGTVYCAQDLVLDRDVAVKAVSSLKLGTEGRSRLLSEARTVAELTHPNIVTVFDAGEFDEEPCAVTEYIEGKTLNETSVEGYKAIVRITNQICTALQFAHDQDKFPRTPRTTRFPPHSAVRSSNC